MTCAHRDCEHYTSGAAWYCTDGCEAAETEAAARRAKVATPPEPVCQVSGLRARLAEEAA